MFHSCSCCEITYELPVKHVFFIPVSFAFPACNIFIAIKLLTTFGIFLLSGQNNPARTPSLCLISHSQKPMVANLSALHGIQPGSPSKPPASDPQKRSNMISSVCNISLLCPRNCEIHLTIRMGLYMNIKTLS